MRGDEHKEMDNDTAVELQVTWMSWVLEMMNLTADADAVIYYSKAASKKTEGGKEMVVVRLDDVAPWMVQSPSQFPSLYWLSWQ